MNEITAKRIAHCIDIAVANVNVAGAGEPRLQLRANQQMRHQRD